MNLRRITSWLPSLAAVFAAGVGIIWSPAANAQGTIQACALKDTGQLRILRSGQCKHNETPVSWNVQGPKGDTGMPGMKGDTGMPGAAGISGLERVDFSSTADSESPKKAFAKCTQGKVVGGGAQVFIAGNASGPVVLQTSQPSKDLDGWAATAEETSETEVKWFVTAFAICAAVAP